MEGVLGVRKGAWTEAEDVLLKGCIQTYGEGNWHKIPLRAGLNRCRKSCRLRWVNYLKPNIKRGEFEEDEVDLMKKLHKLLGNRWSMIAGRLPGRTANDVKNYWNTHLRKKDVISREIQTSKVSKSLSKIEVIKPQPRTLSKSFILKCLDSPARTYPEKRTIQHSISISKTPSPSPSPSPSSYPSHALASDPWLPEKEKEWWETVMEGVVEGGGEGNSLNYMIPVGGSDREQPLKATGEVGYSFLGETERHCWSDINFDNELWDLL